jgi:DNA/RNA-binding domain of Phe-tRNA-synthetase-like protein
MPENKGKSGEKGKPIKGIKATRDPNSGAVVFHDQSGYQRRIKNKRQGKNILLQQKKIEEQERRISAMESKLDQILDLLS